MIKFWTGEERDLGDWLALGYDHVYERTSMCTYVVQACNGSRMDPDPDCYIITQDLMELKYYCDTKDVVRKVFFWLATCLGIPGNLMALITMATMKKSTGTFYVMLLAASDLVTIICRFAEYKFKGTITSSGGCKISLATSNYTGAYANWVLILVCFERYFTIRFPLKKNFYFTNKRAYISAVCLALFLLPIYALILVYYDWIEGSCRVMDEYFDFHKYYWSTVINLTYSVIPALVLAILVVLIAIEIRNIQEQRKSLMAPLSESSSRSVKGQTSSSSQNAAHAQFKEQARAEKSLTIMLFSATLIFLLLTSPTAILIFMKIDDSHGFFSSPHDQAKYQLSLAVAGGLNLLTHAVNFFIYFCSAARFRAHMINLLKSKCCSCYKKKLYNRPSVMETQTEDLL